MSSKIERFIVKIKISYSRLHCNVLSIKVRLCSSLPLLRFLGLKFKLIQKCFNISVPKMLCKTCLNFTVQFGFCRIKMLGILFLMNIKVVTGAKEFTHLFLNTLKVLSSWLF